MSVEALPGLFSQLNNCKVKWYFF